MKNLAMIAGLVLALAAPAFADDAAAPATTDTAPAAAAPAAKPAKKAKKGKRGSKKPKKAAAEGETK